MKTEKESKKSQVNFINILRLGSSFLFSMFYYCKKKYKNHIYNSKNCGYEITILSNNIKNVENESEEKTLQISEKPLNESNQERKESLKCNSTASDSQTEISKLETKKIKDKINEIYIVKEPRPAKYNTSYKPLKFSETKREYMQNISIEKFNINGFHHFYYNHIMTVQSSLKSRHLKINNTERIRAKTTTFTYYTTSD